MSFNPAEFGRASDSVHSVSEQFEEDSVDIRGRSFTELNHDYIIFIALNVRFINISHKEQRTDKKIGIGPIPCMMIGYVHNTKKTGRI